MAVLHHANDLAGAIAANVHTFTVRVTGLHNWFISANTMPQNGVKFTGTVQLVDPSGNVVVNGPGSGQVGLAAGVKYRWNLTGTPNSTVIVHIDDQT